MKHTISSPSPIHDESEPYYCECHVCLSKRIQESTPYWTSTKYACVGEIASEHSKNSTASNLPGLGRTLDHYLGIIGRKCEIIVARKAHGLGLGPYATMVRVQSEVAKYDAEPRLKKRKKAWKNIIEGCSKLLKYMQRCVSSSADPCAN